MTPGQLWHGHKSVKHAWPECPSLANMGCNMFWVLQGENLQFLKCFLKQVCVTRSLLQHPRHSFDLPAAKVVSGILLWAGRAAKTCLEAATAHVASLPAVRRSHARSHGREAGYFEVRLGEKMLMVWVLATGRALKGNGVWMWEELGNIAERMAGCPGEEGESCGDQKESWCGQGLLLVIRDTQVHLPWTLVDLSYKLHRVFPHFLIKQ